MRLRGGLGLLRRRARAGACSVTDCARRARHAAARTTSSASAAEQRRTRRRRLRPATPAPRRSSTGMRLTALMRSTPPSGQAGGDGDARGVDAGRDVPSTWAVVTGRPSSPPSASAKPGTARPGPVRTTRATAAGPPLGAVEVEGVADLAGDAAHAVERGRRAPPRRSSASPSTSSSGRRRGRRARARRGRARASAPALGELDGDGLEAAADGAGEQAGACPARPRGS